MPELALESAETFTVAPELSTPVDGSRRIPQLDGLRAIAILFVFACHHRAFAGWLFGLPAFGWLGVDIFFVLSGFLITSILLRCKGSTDPYIPFLARRAIRIMPPYFLVLFVVMGACYWIDPAQFTDSMGTFWQHAFFYSSLIDTAGFLGRAWRALPEAISVSQVFAVHPLTIAQSGFGASSIAASLTHFWSVSVEEWYYVLWAPVVLSFNRRVIACAALFFMSLAFCCRCFGFIDWQWYLSFPCRVDMLGAGSLFALWHEARPNHTKKAFGDRVVLVLTAASFVMLAAILFHIRPVVGREIRESRIFAGFGPPCIAIIVAGFLGYILHRKPKGVVVAVLSAPALTYIGRRSYMMYLAHVPVYVALRSMLPDWPFAVSMCSLVFTIALASLSWRFLESPLLRHKRASVT